MSSEASSIGGELGSTLRFENPDFERRARLIAIPEFPANGDFRPLDELRTLVRVVRQGRPKEVLLLYSTRGRLKPELLACLAFRLRRRSRRPLVVLYGDLWQPETGLRGGVERWVVRRIDPVVRRYVADSSLMPALSHEDWGIAPEKVSVVPMALRGPAEGYVVPTPSEVEDYVFAGGDSLRDYEPLLVAAGQLPHVRFVFNTVRLDGRSGIPSNVEVRRGRFDEFADATRRSRLVVIPLRTDVRRTVGAIAFLTAAAYARPILMTAGPGVDDYLEAGVHYRPVDGTASGYVDAIQHLLGGGAADGAAMAERARTHVIVEYDVRRTTERLLAVVDDVIAEERDARR